MAMSEHCDVGGFDASSGCNSDTGDSGLDVPLDDDLGIPPRFMLVGASSMLSFIWGWAYELSRTPLVEPVDRHWFGIFILVIGVVMMVYPIHGIWLLRRRSWGLRLVVPFFTMVLSALIGMGVIWFTDHSPAVLAVVCFFAGLFFLLPCVAALYARLEHSPAWK